MSKSDNEITAQFFTIFTPEHCEMLTRKIQAGILDAADVMTIAYARGCQEYKSGLIQFKQVDPNDTTAIADAALADVVAMNEEKGNGHSDS